MARTCKDNRGITLVELMVSITISVIVIGSITYLMSYSSRNYKNISEDITLQTEAQIIINQLNDLIMESHNVKYNSNVLTITHEEATYYIAYDSVTQELLFEKVLTGGSPTGSYQLFGKYVDNFQVVDTGSSNSNNKIKIHLDFKKGTKSYSIHDTTITIRNRIKP